MFILLLAIRHQSMAEDVVRKKPSRAFYAIRIGALWQGADVLMEGRLWSKVCCKR